MPGHDWLPLSTVLAAAQLGELVEGSTTAVAVEAARTAAAVVVERARPDLLVGDTFLADEAVVFGAALQASRYFARRNSPTGLASYGDFGPAAVLRLDPDIERLIGVGRYAQPRIG